MSESPLSEVPSIAAEPNEDVATPATTITSNSGRKRASAASSGPSQNRVKRAKTTGGPVYKEEDGSDEEVALNTLKHTPKKNRTPKGKSKSVAIVKAEVEWREDSGTIPEESPKKAAKKRSTPKKSVNKTEVTEEADKDGAVKKKVVRKRKTKEEKEAEAMPIAARTVGSKIVIGAHVSGAGGMYQPFNTCLLELKRFIFRSSQCHPKQCPHWRQRNGSIPEIPTKVGKSSPPRRSVFTIPFQLQRTQIRFLHPQGPSNCSTWLIFSEYGPPRCRPYETGLRLLPRRSRSLQKAWNFVV
jgi:hypothetical protein